MRRRYTLVFLGPATAALLFATPLAGLSALISQEDDSDTIVLDIPHPALARALPDAMLALGEAVPAGVALPLVAVALALLWGAARLYSTIRAAYRSRGPPRCALV